jgi:hypothetical protein
MTIGYNELVLALILVTAVILAIISWKNSEHGVPALVCVLFFQFCGGSCHSCTSCSCEFRDRPRVLEGTQKASP